MNIIGYSERGVLSSLLYEIRYHADNERLLSELIGKVAFPLADQKPPTGTAAVLVEQSLSDFGDADAVVLVQSGAGRCAVFIEAKVSARKKDWRLADQFTDFADGLKSTVDSSNLFAQLYHKQRFAKAGLDALNNGMSFPQWSSKRMRKIGDNAVVLDAARRIERHCDTAFYLMLVPDTDRRVEEFFNDTLRDARLPEVPDWDVSHYGYLTWATVERFCEQHKLKDTLAVFKYNDIQIYNRKK